MAQQHKRATPVTLKAGYTVMVQVPARDSKLAPKFVGPRLIVREGNGNKFEVFDPFLNTVDTIHCDRLKKTRATDANWLIVPTCRIIFLHPFLLLLQPIDHNQLTVII